MYTGDKSLFKYDFSAQLLQLWPLRKKEAGQEDLSVILWCHIPILIAVLHQLIQKLSVADVDKNKHFGDLIYFRYEGRINIQNNYVVQVYN